MVPGFLWKIFIINSISLLVIGLFRFSSSWVGFGSLCVSKNLSFPSRFPNLLAYIYSFIVFPYNPFYSCKDDSNDTCLVFSELHLWFGVWHSLGKTSTISCISSVPSSLSSPSDFPIMHLLQHSYRIVLGYSVLFFFSSVFFSLCFSILEVSFELLKLRGSFLSHVQPTDRPIKSSLIFVPVTGFLITNTLKNSY